MDAREAFERLGLPQSATSEEIDAAFREQILKEHPDVGGTTDKAMELHAARTIARSASLAPQPPAPPAAPPPPPTRRTDLSAPVLSEMIQRRVTPLRRISLMFGAATLVSLAVLIGLVRGILVHAHPLASLVVFSLAALLFTGIFASSAITPLSEMGRRRRRVQELSNVLDDLPRCRLIVNDLLPDLKGRAPVGRKKMEEDIERCARQMIKRLRLDPWPDIATHLPEVDLSLIADFLFDGPKQSALPLPGSSSFFTQQATSREFGKLFLAKGLEHGYVQQQQLMQRGELWAGYTVGFPSP